MTKPSLRPRNPRFSSGPCAKRPDWSLEALGEALVGRAHRSPAGRARLSEVIERSRRVLGVPDDYRIAIVPGSDTGAVELALWSLLGARGVDVLAWESFGHAWASDVVDQLKVPGARVLEAEYGRLPDLARVDFDRDVVFAWNGTTSGVRVPDGAWIAADRRGLAICDATSAVFAMDLPWDRLDVVTWSWQKVLGGEGGHGMLALSPRAVARLEGFVPPRPLPKIFRLVKDGRLNEAIFRGETINTPSMLCVEDALDGLKWAEAEGGLPVLIERSAANLKTVEAWVADSPWAAFLAERAEIRSSTSICLKIVDPWYRSLEAAERREVATAVVERLAAERAGFDLGAHRDAPPGLRLWGGATVDDEDLAALLPWLDWAYAEVRAERGAG